MKQSTAFLRSLMIIMLFQSMYFEGKSQMADSVIRNMTGQQKYEYYMEKRSANRLAGWITLAGGFGLTLAGFAANVSSGWGPEDKNKGLWLSYLGGASMITSIPLFIAAGKNKRRAKAALNL